MALIDELTQRISAELHRQLDETVRHAIESYVVGDGSGQTVPVRRTGGRRRQRRAKSASISRENRSQTIIDAVAKLGAATIEEVARATGLDKRGVGSSLHYLAAAGRLRHAGSGKYRITRAARAA
jgi:predicted HTH transcriptional regulator